MVDIGSSWMNEGGGHVRGGGEYGTKRGID